MNTPQSNPWAEVDRLKAENARLLEAFERKTLECVELRKQHDEAVYLMNQTSLEFNKTKSQLAATEQALQEVQRESAELREERDNITEALKSRGLELLQDLDLIAREHDSYDFGLPLHWDESEGRMLDAVNKWIDQPASLSPAKQSAVDRGIERAEKIETMQETN